MADSGTMGVGAVADRLRRWRRRAATGWPRCRVVVRRRGRVPCCGAKLAAAWSKPSDVPRGHVDVLQRLRAADVARRHLHDHAVLVQLVVDGRHLALAEGVVERVVDVARGDAQARGAVLVDVHKVSTPFSCWSVSTSVSAGCRFIASASRVAQRFRSAIVVALERVLVGAVALPPAHAQVLHRVEEQAHAGDLRQLRPQPRDHRLAALGARRRASG
jgi:hypothetical protein